MAYARNNKYCWHRHDVECVLAVLPIFFEVAAWNTRSTSEREARLVEALKVCEQDRVRLYGDGQTLKDAISNQVDDALAAYSETKP